MPPHFKCGGLFVPPHLKCHGSGCLEADLDLESGGTNGTPPPYALPPMGMSRPVSG